MIPRRTPRRIILRSILKPFVNFVSFVVQIQPSKTLQKKLKLYQSNQNKKALSECGGGSAFWHLSLLRSVVVTSFTFADIKNCLDDTIGHPKADDRQCIPKPSMKHQMVGIPNPFKTKWKHVFPPIFLNLCKLRVLGANKYLSKKNSAANPIVRLADLRLTTAMIQPGSIPVRDRHRSFPTPARQLEPQLLVHQWDLIPVPVEKSVNTETISKS